MKRLSLLLLTLICFISLNGTLAKSAGYSGMIKTAAECASSIKKDTSKFADKAKNYCKAKKQSVKVKDQYFYSGALDLIVKLFPVLARFTVEEEPLDASTLAQKQPCFNRS